METQMFLERPPTWVTHIHLGGGVIVLASKHKDTYLILFLQAFEGTAEIVNFAANVLVIKHVADQDNVGGAKHLHSRVVVASQEVCLHHLHPRQALFAQLGVHVKSKPAVWINVVCNHACCAAPESF